MATALTIPAVDPDLLGFAFDALADEAARSRKAKLDPRAAAMRAWLGQGGGFDEDGPDAAAIAEVAALSRRLSALGDMLERIEPGARSLDVLVEVAAEAPVFETDGKPRFQLLDFMARVERMAATHAARGCACCS